VKNVIALAEAIGAQYPQDKLRAGLCVSSLGKDGYLRWYVSIVRYPKDGTRQVVCSAKDTHLTTALKALVKAWMPARVELQRLFDQCT